MQTVRAYRSYEVESMSPIFRREQKPKGTPKTIAINLDSGKDLHTPTNGRTRQIDTSDFSYGLTHVLLYDGIELAAKCWIISTPSCLCKKLAMAQPKKSTLRADRVLRVLCLKGLLIHRSIRLDRVH
ncbi:MAG TPA: hypothetical protein VK208_18700 [Pyrinomonadaceae bacterium]|nr:hypothetical protein [Pyrinomonadaceae bacterium]